MKETMTTEPITHDAVVTTLWCGYCGAPFNTEHRDICKETRK